MIYTRSGLTVLKLEPGENDGVCRCTFGVADDPTTIVDYPIAWLRADGGIHEIAQALGIPAKMPPPEPES